MKLNHLLMLFAASLSASVTFAKPLAGRRPSMVLDVFALPQALKTAGYSTGIFGKWQSSLSTAPSENALLKGRKKLSKKKAK